MPEENKNEQPPTPDYAAQIAEMAKTIAALQAKLEAKPQPEDDLKKKSDDALKKKQEEEGNTADLERAISFNMNADKFYKDNADILPSEIESVLEVAKKEKYDTALQKEKAIKSAVIQAFFAVQENLDNLTASQKFKIDNFLKLSKSGKEEKASETYDAVFEPSVEMKKAIKKAEDVKRARNGYAESSDVMKNYIEKMKKHAASAVVNKKA